MLKIHFNRIFFLLASGILMSCHNGSGNAGSSSAAALPITTKNISGDWQMVSVGNTPAKLESAAQQAGYKGSYETLQYQISETKFRVITSDELAVTFSDESDYQLQGKRLSPQNTSSDSIQGFDIVAVTANTLVVKPIGSQPADILETLTRISDADLATNKLKPIEQTVSYTIKTSKVDVTNSYSSSFPSDFSGPGTGTTIECSYQNSNLQISSYEFTVTADGQVTAGGSLPNMNFVATPKFDFSKASETINLTLTSDSSAGSLQGLVTKNSQNLGFRLGSSGSCAFSLKRQKRILNITNTCEGVEVTSIPQDASSTGRMIITEQCVLDF